MKTPINHKPFSHHCSWGHSFKSDTCDFSTPIVVHSPRIPKTVAELDFFARDVAEMIAYHATNIYPELNGFRGYDCIKFEFRK